MADVSDNKSTGSPTIGKLRGDLRLFPSGPESWTLFDPVADMYFKLDAVDYALLAQLDRPQTLIELAERVNIAPEMLNSRLAFLAAHGLMESLYGADVNLGSRRENLQNARLTKWLLYSYLFLDIPLLRPDRFFERTAPWVLRLFSPALLLVLTLVSIWGYLMLLPNMERLTSIFWHSINISGIVGYALALWAIKIIHECAHAYAAKSQNVRVRRMGIAFIVFIPRFYTDITDAWQIPQRSRRAIIDGAGIVAELLIGGLAAIVWCYSAPGVTNTIAYYIFAVSVLNTVFINGNPFIKYDGYFLLMDLVAIDNLYQRGSEMLRRYFRSFVLGMTVPSLLPEQRLTGWRHPFIVIFAIASIIYRFFLYTAIIAIVYLEFTKVVGIMLFMLEIYLLFLKPLTAEFKAVYAKRTEISRRRVISSGLILMGLVLLLFVPLPWNIAMPGEIRSGFTQTVCAREAGYLSSLDVRDGVFVRTGQTLFCQVNPFIDWNIRRQGLEAASIRREIDQVSSNPKYLSIRESQLKRLDGALQFAADLERRKKQLRVVAGGNGIFSLYSLHLKPGKWLSAGEPIGEVFDPGSVEVIAYAGEADIALLKSGARARIFLPGMLESFTGQVVQVNAAPVKNINAITPLSDLAGGPLTTINSPQRSGWSLVDSLYLVKIVPDSAATIPIGRTGTVEIRIFYSPGISAFRYALARLQKELSF